MNDRLRGAALAFLRRAVVAALILATACGAVGRPASTGSPTTSPAAAPPTGAASPTQTRGSDQPPYPNVGTFSDPLDQFSYKYAFDECGIHDLAHLAGSYGGDPTKPASVAEAYAAFSNPSHHDATFLGCLDAIRARQESGS